MDIVAISAETIFTSDDYSTAYGYWQSLFSSLLAGFLVVVDTVHYYRTACFEGFLGHVATFRHDVRYRTRESVHIGYVDADKRYIEKVEVYGYINALFIN